MPRPRGDKEQPSAVQDSAESSTADSVQGIEVLDCPAAQAHAFDLRRLATQLQAVHAHVMGQLSELHKHWEDAHRPAAHSGRPDEPKWPWQRCAQRNTTANSRHQSSWMPALASMSMGGVASTSAAVGKQLDGGSSRGVNPQYQLAMVKDEVKARLAPIPVYTVANPKNEFVLVAGEHNTQLGFFFFRREDAEAIVDKIREENPRLARDSRILKVTMDNVYEVFTTPRDLTGLQGIHFRFMPDMKQVAHALSLYEAAGVPTRSFTGVPVFQAEGLTVTTQDMHYVPLFLSKEDLDVAVTSAYRQRNAAQIQVYRDKAAKYADEYNQVAVQASSAQGKEKSALEARAAKAKAKLDTARDKAAAVETAPMPKIEVGCFEEVMQRMTESSGNELAAWSQVMFVAPGLLQQKEADTIMGATSSKK